MSTIILKAEGELEDNVAREFLSKMDKRVENINIRTKGHTIDFREIRKENKERDKRIKKLEEIMDKVEERLKKYKEKK